MGGNALNTQNLATTRLDREVFERVRAEVVDKFHQAFPGVRIQDIPAYSKKADFGDLDLLVEQEALEKAGGLDAVVAWASTAGHSRGYLHYDNSSVVSLDWRQDAAAPVGFQVDLIGSPASEFDFCLRYFSYNDLGNLMGRVAESMGFVYGHRGLLYRLREGTHQYATITVSRDNDQVMSFMGYDPVRFAKGFADLEEIFEFAASSPYFNKEMYLLENRNHAARTRDKKRDTYKRFLEWLEQPRALPAYPFPFDHAQWLEKACEFFPDLAAQVEKSNISLRRNQFIKTVFNGTTVAELTGLSGPALGQAMRHARDTLGEERLELILREKGLAGVSDLLLAAPVIGSDQVGLVVAKAPRP